MFAKVFRLMLHTVMLCSKLKIVDDIEKHLDQMIKQ